MSKLAVRDRRRRASSQASTDMALDLLLSSSFYPLTPPSSPPWFDLSLRTASTSPFSHLIQPLLILHTPLTTDLPASLIHQLISTCASELFQSFSMHLPQPSLCRSLSSSSHSTFPFSTSLSPYPSIHERAKSAKEISLSPNSLFSSLHHRRCDPIIILLSLSRGEDEQTHMPAHIIT